MQGRVNPGVPNTARKAGKNQSKSQGIKSKNTSFQKFFTPFLIMI
jgi:hypothetical protein